MNTRALLLPSLALAAAGSFIAFPASSDAFSTNGAMLNYQQRDFRIYNNYTDAAANSNTTPDPDFPGYTGAELAIWKGAVEWGSELHGGSSWGHGGANFDASFQGNANGVGGLNDNTHSELSGSSGPTLAFAEGPYSNGWRIRYYRDGITYNDGPGSISFNQTDLQAVATHEFGHCLGLGHSAFSSATMYGSVNGNSIAPRTISADDIAGIQQIYGVAAPNKPHIDSVTLIGSNVTIVGDNFAPTGNRVWFTQATSGGTGSPVEVIASSAAGGTTITVPLPGNAGPGDVLVRANSTANSAISNAQPFDPSIQTCPPPFNYCTGEINSLGLVADCIASGPASTVENNFSLTSYNLPPNEFGIFFYGPNVDFQFFGDGFLCVGAPFNRYPVVQADSFGFAFYEPDLTTPPTAAGQITPGSLWRFQFWYRDPNGGPNGFNLSTALEVSFCD